MRVLLALIFAGVIFGKGCLCMSLYVWVRGWWSAAEQLLYTYEALLGVPWVLLLSHCPEPHLLEVLSWRTTAVASR